MAGAHQNLNGLSDLTATLSGMLCHSWASTCYDQPYAKFEVSMTTLYEDMKGEKCGKWGGLGQLRVTQDH